MASSSHGSLSGDRLHLKPGTHDAAPSDAAVEFARRLLAREPSAESGNGASTDGAERVFERLASALSRSFGPYGSTALAGRALARAQVAHPSLRDLAVGATQPASITGFAAGARAHGVAASAEGAVALLATLTDVIGRLIGTDLAMKLLEQSITPSASAPAIASDGTHRTEANQ